jgi:hypothetical protein
MDLKRDSGLGGANASGLSPAGEVSPGERVLSLSDLQKIRAFLSLILFGFYLLILIAPYGGEGLFKDPDIFWHITVGRDIWRSGAFPHVDPYSMTFQGQPWIANEWLGGLLFYAAYASGSWRGVILLSVCTLALSYALLFFVLSRKMRLTVAAGLATAAFVFSIDQFNLRPYVFAYPLIVIWVAGLLDSLENNRSPSLLLLPIMALWANLHGSFTFGLAIAAALAVEPFFTLQPEDRRRVLLRWVIFLLAAFAFACMTPYGYRSMLPTLQVFLGNEALAYIPEWQPLTLDMLGPNTLILLGTLFLAMFYGVKLPFRRLLITIGLTYLMFAHVRFTALFALVVPLLLLAPLTSQFPFLRLQNQLETERHLFERLAAISQRLLPPVCVLLLSGVAAFAAYGPPVATRPNMTPAGAVDYIRKEHLTGNIYNFYAFGGYLIFEGMKTFVDGRSDQLFGNGFLARLVKTTRELPKNFVPLLSEYNVSIALVVPNSLEAQELERSPLWQKVYSDRISVVFTKRAV